MKKIIAGLTLALMVALVPVAMVGCKTSVYGTYKFYGYNVTTTHELTPEEKQAMDEEIAATTEEYKALDFKFHFNKDGTASFVVTEDEGQENFYWKKEGKKYILYYIDDGEEDVIGEVKFSGNKASVYFTGPDGSEIFIFKK